MMSYSLGRSAAAAMIPAALTVRLFFGMAVDLPQALNASWICPLLGFLIYLPLGLAINQSAKLSTGSPWENIYGSVSSTLCMVMELIFSLLLIYDCSTVARLTASSSNIIALNDVTVHLLVLPLALVIAAVVLLGADAVGNSARIWLRVLPLFLLILLFVQIKNYRINWLAPILGSGIQDILSGSLYCAGSMALLSLPWLIAVPDRNKKGLVRYIFLSACAAALLLVIQHLSYPVLTDIHLTQAARIELILSNGRMSLSPQLLLDILWYGGLLYLIAAEVSAAALFLHHLFPKAAVWQWALIESILIVALAIFNPQRTWNSTVFTKGVFILIGALMAALLLTVFIGKRGAGHAKE